MQNEPRQGDDGSNFRFPKIREVNEQPAQLANYERFKDALFESLDKLKQADLVEAMQRAKEAHEEAMDKDSNSK